MTRNQPYHLMYIYFPRLFLLSLTDDFHLHYSFSIFPRRLSRSPVALTDDLAPLFRVEISSTWLNIVKVYKATKDKKE